MLPVFPHLTDCEPWCLQMFFAGSQFGLALLRKRILSSRILLAEDGSSNLVLHFSHERRGNPKNADVTHRKREILRLAHKSWNVIQQRKVVSVVVKVNLVVILSVLFLGVSLGLNTKGAHAESAVTQQQHTEQVANSSAVGSSNPYPYPACTWWGDERYHELHGVYVPWTTNASAYEWTARALQFGWHVSSQPSPGAIIDLQPWVQGAYGYGHVAVVEQVLSDGSVIASNMSWGYNPYSVVYWHFYQGYGVTFITQ